MAEDYTYAGLQIIDLIAYLDIHEWLENPIMDNIVASYWEGPYQRELFLQKSTSYRVVDSILEERRDKKYNVKGAVTNPRMRRNREYLGMKNLTSLKNEFFTNTIKLRRGN